jgi:predicted dehydrogenase
METVRVAFIGVGARGRSLLQLMCALEGVELKALCDIHAPSLELALNDVVAAGRPRPQGYTGDAFAYRELLARGDLDVVLIATPWELHAAMAVDTMNSGKHALVEVPAALTLEECWRLVDTAERTQLNCMMLENVCYGRQELMALNLVRQGLLGELLHGEAAYIHELRWMMDELERGEGSWRPAWHTRRNANLYPTHGLGPLAQYMGINRGDRFDYLSSFSSPALGLQAYARQHFPPEHPRNQARYICGDINSSLIKTVRGRTLLVQHDTTTPRPYTRHNLIQGTNGVVAGFPERLTLEYLDGARRDFETWDQDMEAWYARFEHPLWQRMGREAEQNGGHGGMDFLMLWRLIYCLRNGEPLDQNVYDAAAWSSVIALSEASVADRGNSKDFPDFTRGEWETTPPLPIVS